MCFRWATTATANDLHRSERDECWRAASMRLSAATSADPLHQSSGLQCRRAVAVHLSAATATAASRQSMFWNAGRIGGWVDINGCRDL